MHIGLCRWYYAVAISINAKFSTRLLASNYLFKCRYIHVGHCSAVVSRFLAMESFANQVQSAILQLGAKLFKPICYINMCSVIQSYTTHALVPFNLHFFGAGCICSICYIVLQCLQMQKPSNITFMQLTHCSLSTAQLYHWFEAVRSYTC